MGKPKHNYYYIYEVFGEESKGDYEERTHKYYLDWMAFYQFFKHYLTSNDGLVHHFKETEEYFQDHISSHRDENLASSWQVVALKKWKGWEKFFRIVYKLTIRDGGKECTTYYLNQKELIEAIEKLENKFVYLYQPQGWGTPISVYERKDVEHNEIYEQPWENEKIEGYDIEYILIEDNPAWNVKIKYVESKGYANDGNYDEKETPKHPKKRPTQVDDAEEEDMVDLPF